MGLLGRYLDALPDTARDRVIEAQLWGMGTLVDAEGNRCLLGHAEDWLFQGSLFRNRAGDPFLQRWRVQVFGSTSHLEIGRRFDMVCHRVGVIRAVQLTKRRAAQLPGGAPEHTRALAFAVIRTSAPAADRGSGSGE